MTGVQTCALPISVEALRQPDRPVVVAVGDEDGADPARDQRPGDQLGGLAGAYVVFVLLLVIYVGIMATKLQRIEKELREVASVAEQRKAEESGAEADREVRA